MIGRPRRTRGVLREVALVLMDSGEPMTVAGLMRHTHRSDGAVRNALRQMVADGRVVRQRVEQRGIATWRWRGERDDHYGRDSGVWCRPRKVLPEVADALRRSGWPLTVVQVVAATGRSEPAVRLALKELLARQQVARRRVRRWSRGSCWVAQWWWTGPLGAKSDDDSPAAPDVAAARTHALARPWKEGH